MVEKSRLLDGKALAAQVKIHLAQRVEKLKEQGITPGLGTVLIGEDPGSHAYVNGKHKDCAEVGISSIRREFSQDITEQEVLDVLQQFNEDPQVTAYIVQLPLPRHLDTASILDAIAPAKDADGLHPNNLGHLVLNVDQEIYTPVPCTPRGIIELMLHYGIVLQGKHVVVVGRGVTVGRSIGLLLTRRDINATVTLTHTGTKNLAGHMKQADIIIAAAGSAHLIQAKDLKPGCVVLDVGVSRVLHPGEPQAKLLGDVDPNVGDVASWISPNPGGVGPMTRVMLLTNVVEIAEQTAQVEKEKLWKK